MKKPKLETEMFVCWVNAEIRGLAKSKAERMEGRKFKDEEFNTYVAKLGMDAIKERYHKMFNVE